MPHSLTNRFGNGSKLLGLFVAVLALMGQLAIGAIVPPQAAAVDQLSALDAALILCHSDNGSTPGDPSPIHHHYDCALCPLCQVLAHFNVVLTADPPLPAPSVGVALRGGVIAAARAPPATVTVSAYPRGPPILA